MDERDQLLIKIAGLLDPIENDKAFILRDMAKSGEAYEEINRIAVRLYRMEEGNDI